MMANRKLPFGYCMQNGQIHIVEAEAEVVRAIPMKHWLSG